MLSSHVKFFFSLGSTVQIALDSYSGTCLIFNIKQIDAVKNIVINQKWNGNLFFTNYQLQFNIKNVVARFCENKFTEIKGDYSKSTIVKT